MGMKPRARTFACWVCMDTGFVQEWERDLPVIICAYCEAGRREAKR